MLMAHDYAFSRNLTYGGACSRKRLQYQTEHEVLIQGLGLQEFIPFACPNPNANANPVLLESKDYKKKTASVFAPDWIQHIQQRVHYPASDAKNRTSVVVHIRRGDVNPCTTKGRSLISQKVYHYLPNSHYLHILQRYAPSSASVSIYSETKAFETWNDFRNFSLQLDAPLQETWQAMMTADVLILSKSSFSFVPARPS
jgi:hypothetical protein